jgi:hypothetical protein
MDSGDRDNAISISAKWHICYRDLSLYIPNVHGVAAKADHSHDTNTGTSY